MDQSTDLAWYSLLTIYSVYGSFIPFLILFPLSQPKLPAQIIRIHSAVLAEDLSWAVDTVRPSTSKPGLCTGFPT